MRPPILNKVLKLIEQYDLCGKVLEIGAYKDEQSARQVFTAPRFEYSNLDISDSNVPSTIVGDITDCKNIEKESFDVVFCSDVFEHINRPWLAAKEISRILKPNGYALIFTVWSWRYHPLPIDYWRFSPECLKFLFSEMECIEADFDMSSRRDDIRGFWPDKRDYVPIDELGGWRENWGVYFIGRKRR